MERAPGDPKDEYHFLVSAVAPRPIAWVTTVDGGTVNAAPFSWFQSVCADPPTLMLSIGDRPGGGPKDTLRNIEATGEFVVNVVPRSLAEAMVQTSAPFEPGVSEVEAVGLATAPSRVVAPPRLAASPVHLECRLVDTRRFGARLPSTVVFGEVVHIAADDDVLDGRGNVDPAKVPFVGRLGGRNYTAATVFEIARPKL